MIYIGNIEILTAKSAIYLGNVGSIDCVNATKDYVQGGMIGLRAQTSPSSPPTAKSSKSICYRVGASDFWNCGRYFLETKWR
jgi:hypothetical protein